MLSWFASFGALVGIYWANFSLWKSLDGVIQKIGVPILIQNQRTKESLYDDKCTQVTAVKNQVKGHRNRAQEHMREITNNCGSEESKIREEAVPRPQKKKVKVKKSKKKNFLNWSFLLIYFLLFLKKRSQKVKKN